MITKTAALVLLWTLCLCTAFWSVVELVGPTYKELAHSRNKIHLTYLIVLPSAALVLLALPLSGWLADSRFGNFKMFRAGCVLMFLGNVLLCASNLVDANFYFSQNQALFICCILAVLLSLLASLAGGSACLVTVFQLGLDQLPDASSTGIISYVLLFWSAFTLGLWLANSLFMVVAKCIEYSLSVQSLSLMPVLCVCIMLSSFFLFDRKQFIIEPKSPQSLRIIYRVLKFAAKHKAPLNRSAFTYWEEDIPSRLDLGKSRYGGPFTTEQVEDVKTFFRLLLVLLPVWIVAFSASTFGTIKLRAFGIKQTSDNQSARDCLDSIHKVVTYSPWWCCLVALFIYKVCVSCLSNRLPSMLKRLGLHLLLFTLCNILYAFIGYFFTSSEWPSIIHTWLYGFLLGLVVSTSTEFVCAQSPYSMRGLLSGLFFFMTFLSVDLGVDVSRICFISNFSKHGLIISYSIGGGLSIAGFLLYLVVASQYKSRVRDEEYNPHLYIEATYDRYLTQAENSSPSDEDYDLTY